MNTKMVPKERIVAVATELFYKQGYRATGVNEVIKKSGVAKATFYKHFPSKDDLALAYLNEVLELEIRTLEKLLSQTDKVAEKLLVVISWLKEWLIESEFRGCAFLHMVAEVPELKSPLRQPGKALYDGVREIVKNLAEELVNTDPKKYKHIDVESFTDSYMLLFAGTIALAGIYHSDWPVDHALQSAKRLIEN